MKTSPTQVKSRGQLGRVGSTVPQDNSATVVLHSYSPKNDLLQGQKRQLFKKALNGWTEGRTDGWCDRPTDRHSKVQSRMSTTLQPRFSFLYQVGKSDSKCNYHSSLHLLRSLVVHCLVHATLRRLVCPYVGQSLVSLFIGSCFC